MKDSSSPDAVASATVPSLSTLTSASPTRMTATPPHYASSSQSPTKRKRPTQASNSSSSTTTSPSIPQTLQSFTRIKKKLPKSKKEFRLFVRHISLLCCNLAFTCADHAMYFLGPILITVASCIIVGLTYVYFWVVLPMLSGTNWIVTARDLDHYWRDGARDGDGETSNAANQSNALDNTTPKISNMQHILLALLTPTGIAHTTLVLFFLVNILYNYYKCVTTSNSGVNFDVVVRELARATGFKYPETEEELVQCKRDMEKRILERVERRRRELMRVNSGVSNGSSSGASIGDSSNSGISISNGATVPVSNIVVKNGRANATNTATQGANTHVNGDEESQLSPLMATSTASPMQQNSPTMMNQTQSLLQTPTPLQQQQQPMQQTRLNPPNTNTSTTKNKPITLPKIHNWQLLTPTEWSFCRNSHQPKPPRSHYDHVTKSLVLNMDHYCPWMFNTIGYFNYRYFFNFLLFVEMALFYGACITVKPFIYLNGWAYRHQIRESGGYNAKLKDVVTVRHLRENSFVPIPGEKTEVAFGFMLCLSVGLAVLCLGGFHLYLVLSAQSTIEFHGNCAKRRKRRHGTPWKNPYSVGWKGNWEFVYGKKSRTGFLGVITAMLPSGREPEYLPIPINGVLVRRTNLGVDTKKVDAESMTMGLMDERNGNEMEITSLGRDGGGLVERVGRPHHHHATGGTENNV